MQMVRCPLCWESLESVKIRKEGDRVYVEEGACPRHGFVSGEAQVEEVPEEEGWDQQAPYQV